VVVVGRRQSELEETVSLTKTADALAIAGDVTDETFVKLVFDKAVEKFGEQVQSVTGRLQTC
jgi:NADP-dependent 3-hydroxy acid dehydrogenase YdfG